MIVSIISGYLHGLWIEKAKNSKYAKLPLISSIVTSIGVLGLFKYSDFFIQNLNLIFHSDLSLLSLALPIGISFYTFHILSYTIDVYRGVAKVQKSLINFATYVALFPQLVAGPIVRYNTVEHELTSRTYSLENMAYGIHRFVIGLSKKVLIADKLGEFGQMFYQSEERTVLFYWLYAIAYMLQLYFDFSAYSDMGIGLGRMFGFHFHENFNYPFISKSITEFWRRWHMSLGTWFRDYVYIPMGGNRVSKAKWARNIFVVWLLTGVWHGASWNFIVWGLYFAVFLFLEKAFLAKFLAKIPAIFSHCYVIFLLIISFVIFEGDGMTGAINHLRGMFGNLNISLVGEETLYYLRSYAGLLLLAILFSTPIAGVVSKKIKSYDLGWKLANVLEPMMHILLMLLVVGYLVDGSFHPFLYFRF
jgi:alginate O-acetyltransferase complex protein AlgI